MKEKDADSTTKQVKQLQDKPGKNEFLIAGIGASAGGVHALEDFFTYVPKKSGIAYVVILHLSPDYDSQLTEILRRCGQLPVIQVLDKETVQPDHVYVISPSKHLTIENNTITASPNLLMEERRAPVDIFFRSMADEYGPRSIAVILSGTGANGSMGLRRVKERGGVCFVQNPLEAEYNEMPRNAISTNMVDEVLPATKIPEKIIAYKESIHTVEITDQPEKRPNDQQQALREIFTQLRLRTGHDFTNYKRPTLLRRIERRINISGLSDLPSYADYLHDNPAEPLALLKDLLISVTNFFRDKRPFEIIEQEVIPLLFKDKTSKDQVRIWIPGCATGEEAYSIAMLCAEITSDAIDAPKVQIFATDIDDAAISHAREGLYSLNDTADVSPERLRRFFNKEGDRYRIRREVRETIMFATHNFLKDPPFSHLDMVSCRNVMIYLNQVAQERVVETFHFALKPGAFLFLGTSESVDGANDLYSVYSRENHIFRRRQVTLRSYPVPESTPTPPFEKSKTDIITQEQEQKILDRISFADLHQQLLEEYAPPSLVVNEEFEIMHLSERAGRYLQISGGEPTKNLLKLIKPELRLELRSALYQSTQRQTAVEARGLKVTVNDTTETLTIKVRPVLRQDDTAKGFILIIFEQGNDENSREILQSTDESLARQIEEELIRVKIQLRTANEQHDFQAEEMKASNEELQAMNEELRSAAEELETSKEELQSINEELRTVNQELKVKIEETSIASNNLQNIINSTDIGTIFLDRSFRVALYTPAAGAIFNLIPADYGRPLTDITHKLEYLELQRDAEKVLDKLTIIEKEVRTIDGNIYLMRLTPYRTDEDRINGIIISFINITERKQAEEALRAAEDNYRQQLEQQVEERTAQLKESRDHYLNLVENTPDIITRWDKDLKLIFANSALEKKTGTSLEQLLGKTYLEMGQPDDIAQSYFESLQKAFRTGETVEHYKKLSTLEGVVDLYSRMIPEKNALGEVESILATARDITDLKKAGEEIKHRQELLQATMDSSPDMIQVFEAVRDQNGEIVDFTWILNNNTSIEAYGDVIGKRLLELNPGVVKEGIFDTFKQVVETGIPNLSERHYIHEQFNDWFYQTAVKLNDGVASTTIKITDLKKAEQEIKSGREFLRSILDSSLDVIQVFKAVRDSKGTIIDFEWVVQNSKGFEQNENVVGERLLEKNPGVIEAGIFDNLVKVTQTGIPVEMEQYYSSEQFDDSWFYLAMVRQDDGVVMTTRNITEQIRAEKELLALKDELAKKANDRYLELFNSIDEGFCIIKVLFDENDEAYDYVFIDANKAFEKQTGIKSAVGRSMLEIQPNHESYWFKTYGRIVKSQQPERFENKAKELGLFHEVYAFPTGHPEEHHVAVLFNDITQRKKEEKKQQAILELSDVLRSLADSTTIKKASINLAAAFLEADVAFYFDIVSGECINFPENSLSFCPFVPNNSHGELEKHWMDYFHTNEYLIVENASLEALISKAEYTRWEKAGISSLISIPVLKENELVAIQAVGHTKPHQWEIDDAMLLKEIAYRTWTTVERAYAEEALKISKEKYRYLFESIDEGYCIIEVLFDENDKPYNWKFIEVNPAFEKNNGLTNASGKTILEMTPGIEEKWFEIYGRVAKTGQPIRFKEDSKALNRHFDLYAFPVGDPKENLVAVIFTDISQRVLSEEALRYSEERLRVTMKSAVDFVIITLDVEGRIDQWNTGAEEILGYTAEEVHGKHYSLIFTEEDQAEGAAEKELQSARENGMAEDGRWHRRKDGSHFFMNGVVRPIYNPELTGYAKVARDMTDHQQAQEQLKVYEERSRIALESAGMASWDWDIRKDLISWNENHYKLLGLKNKEKNINTAFFAQFVHPDDKKMVMEKLQQAVDTASEFIAEFRIIRADNGKDHWMKGYGSTVGAEDGHAVRMVGVMFDITEQRDFTEELSRQVKERTAALERSNDDLLQFAHAASHDLKEPVRKIRTFYYRILEEFADILPEDVKGYLERIESAAARMYAMIDGVLHYTKPSSDYEEAQSVNLNKVVSSIKSDLEVLMENKAAEITSDSLPHVSAHFTLIYQLFYNLILNSLKFAKEGVPARIHITSSEKSIPNGFYWQIDIQDNGIGFNPEQSEKIFNTFTRLNTADRYEGSGMGLALCKKIVERYNGSITAKSTLGNGAVFTILLPAVKP
ncbi:PAS domain S-box protein [Flavobacterium foetidum]|uniref:PAS domain S-box protein n=1 Tax=Flavobacterium foetidum TaxID=2026681 RepID=UPI0010751963|nr:PAS domain S-box protein [Flavobacterium foetidum]KAF2514864.1 PAS domain S-box protein [Flavobacterium foetidum]